VVRIGELQERKKKMSDQARELNILNLTHTSIRQFRIFMKAIADNNLWAEVEQHL
jgi:hypothetical protein